MIPDGVESIGYNAFFRYGQEYFVGGDKIEYVHIPSSVKNISSTAFSENPDIAFYIDLSKAPSGWESGWNNKSSNIYWLGEWEYVDGVPTPINK